eukprot:s299_g33.t1
MAEDLQQLTLHAAWSAANERSFLWHSASRDRRSMDEAALRLQRAPASNFTAEAVEAMKQLALCAAWHAANQRRFFYSDAEKDRRGVEFYAELLERLTSRDLAGLIKRLAWDAAWHAANTRSMMWKDAAKDIRNFQRTALELSTFLGDGDAVVEDMDDGDSEGFRTPDSGSEAGEARFPGFEGLPLGRVPQGARPEAAEGNGYGADGMDGMDGISNLGGPRSVLDEAILGWRETSNKMKDDQICATSFVKAALATIVVFDSFGKMLQSFQADMRKNAKMIQQHVRNDQVSLQDLIDGECKQAGSYAKAIVEGSAAMGLLWLTRALRLLEKTLQVLDEEQQLHRCIQLGYEASLRPHHNFLTRNVIQAGIRAAPSREHFLSKLSPNCPNPKEKIQDFLKFYSPVLCKAHEYLLNCRLET